MAKKKNGLAGGQTGSPKGENGDSLSPLQNNTNLDKIQQFTLTLAPGDHPASYRAALERAGIAFTQADRILCGQTTDPGRLRFVAQLAGRATMAFGGEL